MEKQHEVIFGLNDIKNAGKSNKEPDHESENAEIPRYLGQMLTQLRS